MAEEQEYLQVYLVFLLCHGKEKSCESSILVKFRVEKCEVLVKEVAKHNLVSDIKLDIPKFGTALLHSNWSNLRLKYLSQIPTDIHVLSCGPKA